jgi:hypothetical protein
MTEQDQESTPLPRHTFDMVPPIVRQLFEDVLKYRVDPSGKYYNVQLDTIINQLQSLDNQSVVAIDSDTSYSEKGHMYDPILQSFVQGAGGQISNWEHEQQSMTPVVLRGVTKRKQMAACRAAGRDFYYIDTGYFGNKKKKTYHRITRNDVQNFGPIIDRPADRVPPGVGVTKFRKQGSKILLAPPSQKLLNLYNINLDEWLAQTQANIRQHTDREIVVRLKQGRSVRQNTDTIQMALDNDVFCLVTFSSIAAVEALLHGKPAITLGPNAAAPLCSHSVSEIETLKIPTLDEVEALIRHLSYCQFNEAEMRDGTAWRILNGL